MLIANYLTCCTASNCQLYTNLKHQTSNFTLSNFFMGRILSIDSGKKRTGLAVTDPLQLIASGLTTVPTHELIPFLKKYMTTETVTEIIIGDPKNLDGSATDATALVTECIRILHKHFPALPVKKIDERFTSKL